MKTVLINFITTFIPITNHHVDPLMNYKQSSSVYLFRDLNSKDMRNVRDDVERSGLRMRAGIHSTAANTHLYSER